VKNSEDATTKIDLKKYRAETTVTLRGHLIDSMILTKVLNAIYDMDGEIEVLDFKVGRTKEDYSESIIRVYAKSKEELNHMIEVLQKFGAIVEDAEDVKYEPAPKDFVLPDNFYSTTHHPTFVRLNGEWVPVKNIEMDKAILIKNGEAYATPMSEVKKGDLIVVGTKGIRIVPTERPRKRGIFEFMTYTVSSERPASSYAEAISEEIIATKKSGGKIIVVAGPAVIHSGARDALAELIRLKFVDVLFSGNALAVHDIEVSLFGTSLGINLKTMQPTEGGHRHHLAAINTIRKIGSIKKAVESGVVKNGIFYECIKGGVPFVLAGSIRDDGPLPEVITDVLKAQQAMRQHIRNGVDMVLMLASTLHSIATGNMLPSYVKTVCVDVNPAVVAKLMDRGTSQAVGIVSDVGAFLPLLLKSIKEKMNLSS